MFRIKELFADKFGGLINKSLKLKNGLNILLGPNEAGKSSWSDLFDVLMFGAPNKKAASKGDFDQNTYMKYDIGGGIGFGIGGVFEIDGAEYRFKTTGKTCEVVDANMRKVPELCSKAPGKTLFNIDENTFRQTAFLKQMQPFVAGSTEMEKRLTAISQSAGNASGVTFSAARASLDDYYKQLTSKTRASSKLPHLYEKRQMLTNQIEQNQGIYQRLELIKHELLILDNRLKAANGAQHNAEIEQAEEIVKSVTALGRENASLIESKDKIAKELQFEDFVADDGYFEEFRLRFQRLESSLRDRKKAENDLALEKNEVERLNEEQKLYSFFSADDYGIKKERIKKLNAWLINSKQQLGNIDNLNIQLEEKKSNLAERIVLLQEDKLRDDAVKKITNNDVNAPMFDKDVSEVDVQNAEHEYKIYKESKKRNTALLIGCCVVLVIALVCLILSMFALIGVGVAVVLGIIFGCRCATSYNGKDPVQLREHYQNNLNLEKVYTQQRATLIETGIEALKAQREQEVEYVKESIRDLETRIAALPNKAEYDVRQAELGALLTSAGCLDFDDFERREERYKMFAAEAKTKKQSYEKYAQAYEIATKEAADAEEAMKTHMMYLNIPYNGVEDAGARFDALSQKQGTLKKFLDDIEKNRYMIESKLQGMTLESYEEIAGKTKFVEEEDNADKTSDSFNTEFDEKFDKAVQEDRLEELNRQMQEKRAEEGRLRGALDSNEDVDALLAERAECIEEIEKFEEESEAIKTAIGFLDMANTEFEESYAPILNEEAADIYRKITGSENRAITINGKLGFKITENNRAASFDKDSISMGAMEQALFALRLALIKNIYKDSHVPPIIMDDPFVNYDAQRSKMALKLLVELSKEYQIIVTSCHEELVEYLGELAEEVNVIRYSDEWGIVRE